MAYTVTTKDGFFKDFINFNRTDQSRIQGYIAEIRQNPVTPKGDTIKRLRHQENLWRYRFSNHRIVYYASSKRQVVTLLMIGTRGDVYKRLNIKEDAADMTGYAATLDKVLDPDEAAPETWGNFARDDVQTETHLTYLLTKPQLEKWDIPEELHSALMNCRTEEALLESRIPDFYKLRIIDLMDAPANIEDLVQQPNRVLDHEEDLSDVVEGKRSLMDFLLLLDEDQEKLVDFSLKGPTLVKGGAGSGKSTIALYRARALTKQAEQSLIPAKILFTTYTNSLVNSSEQLFRHLVGKQSFNLTVSTVDKIARNIVNNYLERPNIVGDFEIRKNIGVMRYGLHLPGSSSYEKGLLQKRIKSLTDNYLYEEIQWVIEGRGIETEAEYLDADRSGRGIGLNENMRKLVWQIYQMYDAHLEGTNQYTWSKLRKTAHKLVKDGKVPENEKFEYILIDEAQDLSPIAISLCVEMCKSPAGVFLTADSGQSIYNRGFSWKRVHDDLKVQGRTRVLKRNYRTTREIAMAANSILDCNGCGDLESLDQFFVHSGPRPVYYPARNEEEMLGWLLENIKTALHRLKMPKSAAAVLCRKNEQAEEVARVFSQNGLTTRFMRGRDLDLEADCVKAITIHSAKGLEFPVLGVPWVEEGNLPRFREENAEDEQLTEDLMRRLLYVGMSRAMRRLFISFQEDKKSRFLEDLSLWSKGELRG